MTLNQPINGDNFTIQFKNDMTGSQKEKNTSDQLGVIYFYNVEHTMMNKPFNVTMCTFSDVCTAYGATQEEAGDTGRWILPENKHIQDAYFSSVKNMTFVQSASG